MRIDHIGYAVQNIEKAMQSFKELGYDFGQVFKDEDRNVMISFGTMDGYRIELIAPFTAGGTGKSPITDIISRMGPTPYHICYATHDLEREIERLKNMRYKVTIPPARACAFDNKRVVFMYNLNVGLIEIVEE